MEFIETNRLVLRPWNETDAPALFRYAGSADVGPAAGWPPHTSVENSLEIIRTVFCVPEVYAVVPKAVGEPVGCCGVLMSGGNHPNVIKDDEAEIGYWIGVPFWGQGLIPEAVDALLDRCFNDLGLKAVWIAFYDGNDKSRRVAEKCGFSYHHIEDAESLFTGVPQKEYLYRLTFNDYRNR